MSPAHKADGRRGRAVRICFVLVVLLVTSGCSRLAFWRDDPAPVGGSAAGAQVPLITLEVAGVDGALADDLADNVRAHVSVDEKPCTTAPAYLRALGPRTEEETLKALQAFGHYAPAITVSADTSGTCPHFTVTIVPGPAVTVAEVDVQVLGEAGTDPAFARAVAELPLKAGASLNHADYEASKQRLRSIALERGYLEHRFEQRRLEVLPDAGSARALIVFDSGPRYRAGELTLSQEGDAVDRDVIDRYLDYAPGAPYHASVLTRLYSALSNSGYFAGVEVRPRLATNDACEIPLDIVLTPRKPHRFSASLGASTDEGPRSRFSYKNARVNSRGHRYGLDLGFSAIEQSLSNEYELPREHPADEWLSFQAGLRREDVDTFDTLELNAGVSETKRRPWGFLENHFLNVNFQSFDVGDESDTTLLLMPGVRWNKAAKDNALYPRRAYSIEFEVRGAPEDWLSETRFGRAALNLRGIYGLGETWRLLSRVNLGATIVGDLTRLPPSERFFAGGDNSIRGFDFQDLGPEDDDGDVIGGLYLGVVSVEVEKSLSDRWGVAAFVDAGNAFGGEGGDTGIEAGLGLGLRWYSPIGPARIDLAHPLDADNLVRLHLRIGPDL